MTTPPATLELRPSVSAPPRRLRAILDRLADAGALPTDPPDERIRKASTVLTAVLIIPLSTLWVATYFALGLPVSASIPLGYQVVSLASLAYFLRSKRYRLFRSGQLALMLVLPFLLQWSLGGFVASSAVMLWAFMAPIGALVFSGPRQAVRWFMAYAVLAVVSGAIDPSLASHAAEIPQWLRLTFFVLNVGFVSLTAYLLLHYFVRERDRTAAELAVEREKSERLLLNVLPEPIAVRLKNEHGIIADGFDDVTVLFADIANFTTLAESIPPDEVVRLLDDVFSEFDRLVDDRELEKIKTIGDAYMAAGGLPVPRPDHAEAVADLALAMRAAVAERCAATGRDLSLRIGIDTGPVVAGVIGRRKFIYDLWGDTVNTASRMESHGRPGAIQVTERVHARLRDRFEFEERGAVMVKGKGEMRTYWLTGRREEA